MCPLPVRVRIGDSVTGCLGEFGLGLCPNLRLNEQQVEIDWHSAKRLAQCVDTNWFPLDYESSF